MAPRVCSCTIDDVPQRTGAHVHVRAAVTRARGAARARRGGAQRPRAGARPRRRGPRGPSRGPAPLRDGEMRERRRERAKTILDFKVLSALIVLLDLLRAFTEIQPYIC